MKRIKDFIYNWNDIILVTLIIMTAAGIVYWRVNVIMEYPKVVAEEIALSGQNTPENIIPSSDDAPSASNSDDTDSTNDGLGDSGNSDSNNLDDDSPAIEPGSGPRDGTLWSDGKLKLNITVVVEEGTALDAVENLVEAGLFSSYEDFEYVCSSLGLDPTSILATTYTFSAGSTQEDIALQVTSY